MPAKNPPFTETGLDVAEAYAVAYRFAVTNVIADLIVENLINEDEGEAILDQIKEDTAKAMLGENVAVDEKGNSVFALNKENYLFQRLSENLAKEIMEIAEKMEKEHVAAY